MEKQARTVVAKIEKGTLYLKTEMMGNFVPVEAKDIEVSYGPYAQYQKALYVEFVKKGARTRLRMVQHYRPSLVILEGWGHAEMNAAVKVENARTLITHDPSWDSDFDAALKKYLSTRTATMHDYRDAARARAP